MWKFETFQMSVWIVTMHFENSLLRKLPPGTFQGVSMCKSVTFLERVQKHADEHQVAAQVASYVCLMLSFV